MLAAQGGHLEVVKELVRSEANVNAANKVSDRVTSLDYLQPLVKAVACKSSGGWVQDM